MCEKLIHVCEKMRILTVTEEYGEKSLCAGGKITKLEGGYIWLYSSDDLNQNCVHLP